jgi:hypothetical protein
MFKLEARAELCAYILPKETLAFAAIDTIAIHGSLEGSVSSVGLQKTTTKVTVRLAKMNLKSQLYVITGAKAGQDSVVKISGSDMPPLSHTKVDKAGLYFSCEVVAELVLKPAVARVGRRN